MTNPLGPQTRATDALASSVEQSAAMAGVGRTFLYGEIKAGRLRARKAGRRTVVLRSDLEAWLQALSSAREVS